MTAIEIDVDWILRCLAFAINAIDEGRPDTALAILEHSETKILGDLIEIKQRSGEHVH